MTKPPSAEDARALFVQFIADADAALAERRPATFWPRNHHRLRPIEKQARALLTPAEFEDYLFHRLCRTGGFPALPARDLPLLIPVWRRVLPHLDKAPARAVSRHLMLFLFGFDDLGPLPEGDVSTGAALAARMKLIDTVTAFTTQPNQRAKKARFAAMTDHAPRILQTLRHLGYAHDRRYGGEIYNITDLGFWGMVLVLLLDPRTRADVLEDMTGPRHQLVQRETQLSMLNAYVQDVRPDVPPEDRRFHDLAVQLHALQTARRDATESAALARDLGLPFASDEDWAIFLRIPLRAAPGGDVTAMDAVNLEIHPNPDWPWRIRIDLGRQSPYVDRGGDVSPNTLGLPVLGAGNLHRFPHWLGDLRRDHGLDGDIAAAEIGVGRKRAAAKPLAAWLAGEVIVTR